MSPTLVILSENGLPDPEPWTAELKAAGLDIEVHSMGGEPHREYRIVALVVCGQATVLRFEGRSTLHKEWFPSSISTDHPQDAVALFIWQGNGTYLHQAAEWAAVASLARLTGAEVFDGQGLPGKSPEAAYERARELVTYLAANPSQASA